MMESLTASTLMEISEAAKTAGIYYMAMVCRLALLETGKPT
jgi:hypothetical protein